MVANFIQNWSRSCPLGGILQVLGDFRWTLSTKINDRLGLGELEVDEWGNTLRFVKVVMIDIVTFSSLDGM